MVAHGRPSDEGCRRPPEFPPRGRQVVFGNREADRDVCAATLRSHPPRACIEVQRLRLSIRKNEADPEGFESRNDDKRRADGPTNVAVGINGREVSAIGASATETTSSPADGATASITCSTIIFPATTSKPLVGEARGYAARETHGRVHDLPDWIASSKGAGSAKR